MNVSLSVCIRLSTRCFRQVEILTVNIVNRNDNEPKLSTSETSLNLTVISELMRSINLFELDHTDGDSSPLRIQLFRVKVVNVNNCSAVNYQNPQDWFSVYTHPDELASTIQLTDLGYDTLIHFSSKINYFHLRQCYFYALLDVKVTDGLFTNQIEYRVDVKFQQEENSLIHTNIPVPVLNTV